MFWIIFAAIVGLLILILWIVNIIENRKVKKSRIVTKENHGYTHRYVEIHWHKKKDGHRYKGMKKGWTYLD